MKEKILNCTTVETVHTHTHTSSFIEGKSNNKIVDNHNGIYQRNNLSVSSKATTDGITLVALVVTIVVLLILAGVTITYVMGDNSIFKKALDAKMQTEIADYKERLEMAKAPIIIGGLGTFNPDRYFEYIEKQGIINDQTKDVIDNGDGTYEITTKPGYIFEVELVPNKESPTDSTIEYIGQAGKIAPIIKRIETSSTATSITAKAIVTRLGNGTVTYYYKLKTESDSEYKEITNVNAETGATVTEGVTAGTEYIIKVVAKNEAGEVVDTVEITATKIFVQTITLNKTEEVVAKGKTETLIATVKPDDSTNKNVTWTSSDTNIVTVDENGVITGKTEGTVTITASTTDGSNKTASCEITVKSVTLNTIEENVKIGKTVTLTATVLPTNVTNKNVTWSSSNTSIAIVNSSGIVTGIKAGTVTITVSTTDNSKAIATCTVTVKEPTVADIVGEMQTSNKIAKDENGNKIVIPGGFKVIANGTGDVRYTYNGDGSPEVQDGIVIQDSEGNQFVWIPVGNIKNKDGTSTTITLGRYTFDTSGTPTLQQNATNYAATISIEGASNYYYQELTRSSTNTPAKDLGAFVSKTNANGGYYLGRYEASRGSDGKMDSQANKTVWSNITQPDAATAARSMYSSNYVESDLINSYSWDTAIVFIQKYSGNSRYAKKQSINKKTKLNTGKAGDKVCNIHDMASNCREWSTEHFTWTSQQCVIRGGNLLEADKVSDAGSRANGSTTDVYDNYSFRPLCYLK